MMEDDGEGMVAIIEGLQNSAIAITVMNSRRKPRAYGTRRSFKVPMSKSSVETSTDCFNNVNKGAQICDGRYASSYQLAHCNKIPTSPAVVVPEFPPQRAEPCRTQGNFELCGYVNGESYHSSGRFSPQNSFRNGYMSSYSGASVHHSRSTRMDAFAHSLRRYPCLSPDRTMSSEFIQRLITYAQTKHHSKNSRQSKSMRSIPYERSQEMKSTRHVQPNLRTDHETPTKDNNNNIGQINGRSKSRNISADLGNNRRNTRYKDNILNETYDYLKSNVPRGHSKTSEVRTMTKYVRETLKQIYNSKTMAALRVCPEVKRRYDRHLKLHHSCSTETTQPCSCTNTGHESEDACISSKKPDPSNKSCYCNKTTPCNCEEGTSKLNASKESEDEKFGKRIENEINEWLREVPVHANETPEAKATRNVTIKQLSDTLKSLKDDEFSKKCRDEINKFIDSLPMWYPGDKSERDKFKEQLADKLFDRLNRVPKKNKITDGASGFVNNIPPNKTETRAELHDILEEMLTNVEGDRKKELSSLAESLVGTLLKVSPEDIPQRKLSASSKDSKLQRKILEWLNDSPEIQNGSISDKKDKIENLVKILQKYKHNDLNDKNVQSRIQKDIKDWLETVGRLNLASKDKVSRRLLQNLLNSDALKYSKLDNTINQSISDWFDNIPEISGSSENEKKKLVQSLANKLLGLDDENIIRNEIHDWLSETLNENGEHFKIKEIDDLVEQLVREIKNIKVSDENLTDSNRNKSRTTRHFYDDIGSGPQDRQPENKNKQKFNSRKRWDQNDDLPNSIQKEISQIIDQEHTELSKSKKQVLKDKIANVLAKSISNKPRTSEADSMYLPEKYRAQRHLKQQVRDAVSAILKKVNIRPEYQNEIAESISNALEKEISSGMVSNIAEDVIFNILLDANIPEEEVENITSELIKKANEMALVIGRDTSAKTSGRPKLEGKFTSTPAIDIETEAFKNIAEKEILDLFAEETGQDSVEVRNKRKRNIRELLSVIGETIYDLTLSEEDKIEKVIKYLRKTSLPHDVSKERFASELINRIRNLTSKISENIPRKKDKTIYFHPEAESTRISIAASNLADSYQDDTRYTHQENLEKEIMNKFSDIISEWIDELPIDLNGAEDGGFKKTMVKDLAGDVIDRLKYLQLNPGLKSSDEEELEHLKYQVFRWLNKLVSADKLNPILPKVHILMDRLKQVNVPQLVQPSGRKASKGGIPNYTDALKDEISMWIEELPPHLLKLSDSHNHKQLVKRLADIIQQQKDTTNIYLNREIEQCLNEVVKDKQQINNIAESLKNRLEFKGFMGDTSWMPVQNIEENFEGGMMNWLKDQPLYQQRIPDDKRIQEQLTIDLAKSLKRIAENSETVDNMDELLIKEIINQLKQFPMNPEDKYDDQFLRNTALHLLHYLKCLPIFQEILHRQPLKPGYKKPADMLYDNIENWCKDLPIFLGDFPADIEKVQTMKQNIASRLINKVGELNMNPEIFQDDLLYGDLLQDEVDNLLSSIPTNPELEKNLPKLIRNLIVKVKEANQIARDELTGQLYKQQLKDSISKTLPVPSNLSSSEEASFELLKDNVADAFINLHYVDNDEELKNKFKRKINDEVSKFCRDFNNRYPDRPINSDILNRDLYNALCNVTLPNEESMKSEVGQARIKDAINDWIKDLPLEEQSEADHLQQSKMVSVIAKKIHDMEKEESFHPDINNDEKKQKEIVRWMKKLPLKPGKYNNINEMAAKLVNDLNNTEKSRRFSGLSMRSSWSDSSQKNNQYNSLQIPPTTLCQEDCAHLRRIRVRTPLICKSRLNCKDAGFNPCPVDSCTQTQIRPWGEIICKGQTASKCSGRTQKMKASDSCAQSENNHEVSPKVIIREYHWDSTEGSKLSGEQMQHPMGPDPNQSRNYDQPVIPSSICKNIGQRFPSVRNPCASYEPCITPQSTNQNAGPCLSHQKMPCASTPKRPGMRRKRDRFHQRPFNIEPCGHSTGIEEECRYRRNRPRALINSVRFPEEDNFLDAPCTSRMSPITSDEEMETVVRENERNHEQVMYKCREHTNTKCSCRKNQTGPRMCGNDAMRSCSRCSVSYHCPYPSFLYFRK